ncbi:hypothetical protein DYB34_011857 [Aphanomyces astaci]|uniref:BTB domain-containing protein n=1 Tax=Aphanomyces astaci TaxID=112090 RepID=A0A418BF76_APHAT|nr:hypothetical protein DYB34_011857 [Aphanomyces astaci]
MTSSFESTNQVSTAISTAFSQVNAEAETLVMIVATWAELEDRVRHNLHNQPNIITLNVGGTTFQTSKDTLLRGGGTYFHALLGSGQWKPEGGEGYFLDLDPTLFRRVLFFLRTGKILPLDGLTEPEQDEFAAMLEYLKMDKWAQAQAIRVRWDPNAHSPDMNLSNNSRTIELCRSSLAKWQYGVVTKPLTGKFKARVDYSIDQCCIGLGPSGMDIASDSSMRKCYLYQSTGAILRRSHQVMTLSPIETGDVVTIRRAPWHVEFAVNDGHPFMVNLVDPSEDLFPVVFLYTQWKITILDG